MQKYTPMQRCSEHTPGLASAKKQRVRTQHRPEARSDMNCLTDLVPSMQAGSISSKVWIFRCGLARSHCSIPCLDLSRNSGTSEPWEVLGMWRSCLQIA